MPLFDLASARERRRLALAAHPAAQPSGIPARKRLRYEEMIEFVELLVAEGNLAPGDMLPTQAELAAAAGVSLITVRRALGERAGGPGPPSSGGRHLPGQAAHHQRAPGRSGGLLDTLRRAHDAGAAGRKGQGREGQGEEPRSGEPRVGNRLLSLGQGLPSVSLPRRPATGGRGPGLGDPQAADGQRRAEGL